MQHNTTSSTAGCKMPPLDHSKHVHKQGSIQACFANTTLKGNAARLLQGKSNTKDTGKVHYDTNNAGMQHDTTNNAASYKLPPPDHTRHAHKSGSIQACLGNAILKEDATKQVAPRNTVNTSSSTALQHPPAKDNITVDKEMYLQPTKINSDCSIS